MACFYLEECKIKGKKKEKQKEESIMETG